MCKRCELAPRQLDEQYLSGHNRPALVSLPFLPDLRADVERSWRKPYSDHIHLFQHANYARVEGMHEHGYDSMPPVEEMLASQLLLGEASTLKAPPLPTKPLHEMSHLNGRAYAAAGQTGTALHAITVLQAYQADLLKNLDQGQGLSPEAVAELRHTTDLALCSTRQTTAVISRSMAMERHFWVKLADIGNKEINFLLDALVSESEIFGTSVGTVDGKFREVKAWSAGFRTYIPRRSRPMPLASRGPGPS